MLKQWIPKFRSLVAMALVALVAVNCSPKIEDNTDQIRKEMEEMRKTLIQMNISIGLMAASIGQLADASVEVKEAVSMFLENAFSEYDPDDLATKDDFDIDGAFDDGTSDPSSGQIPPGGNQ